MFKHFLNLCLFRTLPSELSSEIPSSMPLFLGILAVHFSTVFFLISIVSASIWVGIWKTVLLELSICGCTAFLFWLCKIPEQIFLTRLIKAYTSLLATNTLILAFTAIPYIVILLALIDSGVEWIYYLGIILNTALLLLASVWLFIIYSRIYRHTLAITVNQSLFMALILFGITAGLFSVLALF